MDDFSTNQAPVTGPGFQPSAPGKTENMIAGIVGSFLGALVGVVVIIVLDQLGYVAAISGLVMGFCALKGYELLGGKLSKKGVVISVIIMILMIWVGNRASWSLIMQQQVFTDESPFSVFRYFNEAVQTLKDGGVDISGDYAKSLAMQYGFAVLGSGSTIFSAFRGK